MPRQARVDTPGLLYHVMARGIERRAIFLKAEDYEDFIARIDGNSETTVAGDIENIGALFKKNEDGASSV